MRVPPQTLLLLLAAAALAAGSPDRQLLESKVQTAIMRGQNATFDRYPWMVDIRADTGEHMCGGSLIAPQVVLTAAHCFVDWRTGARTNWDPIVRIGQYYQSEPPQNGKYSYDVREVTTTWVHRRYKAPGQTVTDYDIALLFLNASSTKTPINLPGYTPKPLLPLPAFSSLMVLGWGSNGTPGSTGTDILQQAWVREQYYLTCQMFYPQPTYSSFFLNTAMCAGDNPFYQVDTCAGDSGGPLFLPSLKNVTTNDVIYGITTIGLECSTANPRGMPGLYTSVARMRPWIDSSIACMINQRCTARMWGDLNVQGFDGYKFVAQAFKGQTLQLLNTVVYQLRGTTGTGTTSLTLGLTSLGLTWAGPADNSEHTWMPINRFGRLSAWINRGSGYIQVTPSTSKSVTVQLIDGYITFFKATECPGPAPTITTTVTTTTQTTTIGGSTTVTGRRLQGGAAGAAADAAAGSEASYGDAAMAAFEDWGEQRSGRQLQTKKCSGKKCKCTSGPNCCGGVHCNSGPNSVAACSLRLEIIKPNFYLKVVQPWNTKKRKLENWLEMEVTLAPAPVQYVVNGVLGLTYPGAAV